METSDRLLWFVVTVTIVVSEVQYHAGAVYPQPKWSCYEKTGGCFYSPDARRSHAEATCWCKAIGGKLMEVKSVDELLFVTGLIEGENRTKGFLVGATDRKREGNFLWEDGTPVGNQIQWHSWGDDTEPDNYNKSEHCVALTNNIWWEEDGRLQNYNAFDVNCQLELYFVCEKTGSTFSRLWKKAGLPQGDGMHPSDLLLSLTGVSVVTCADRCTRMCECLSISYHKVGGRCILYNKDTNQLTFPQRSSGYVNYNF